MTNLASWLLEQIAADEQVAREATEGRWHWVMGGLGKNDRNMLVADAYVPGDGWHTVLRAAEMPLSAVDAEHIARWDPARVLAECAAKRNVVAEYEKALAQRRELAGGPHSTEAAAPAREEATTREPSRKDEETTVAAGWSATAPAAA